MKDNVVRTGNDEGWAARGFEILTLVDRPSSTEVRKEKGVELSVTLVERTTELVTLVERTT